MSRVAEHVAAPWQQPLAAAGLTEAARLLFESPEIALPAGRWERLSKAGLGGRERWRGVLDGGGPPQTVYLKRYVATPLREQWDRFLRQCASHSRAYWEFRQSAALAEASIAAPPPIAFVEEMSGGLERRSAVLLGAVAGEALDRFWRTAVSQGAPVTIGAARHDLTRRLARFIAAFHGTGMCHRDLYLCHVFVDVPAAYDRAPRFALIDLARAHRPRWRRMRWILKDLSQLDASARQVGASRSDRLRFLRAYLALERRAPRMRWYARGVTRRSDRILARIERKSRSR